MLESGIETILFTSDSQHLTGDLGSVDGEFQTTNFKYDDTENLDALLALQPNRPILVSEYWPGWFDHWFEPFHDTLSVPEFAEILGNIFAYEGSVNFYMFHGGTNLGFMNGGNIVGYGGVTVFPFYAPTITSYGEHSTKYIETSPKTCFRLRCALERGWPIHREVRSRRPND